MKLCLLVALLVLGVVHAAPQAPTGTVQGVVRRPDTGEPIADVRILLAPAGAAPSGVSALWATLPGGMQITPSLQSAMEAFPRESATNRPPGTAAPVSPFQKIIMTEANGRFVLTDIPPGQYSIRATRDGYVGPSVGGIPGSRELNTTPFLVEGGEPSPEVSLSMLPTGSISGRVRDDTGLPITGITVTAYRTAYAQGRPAILGFPRSVETDDQGEFRIFSLAAGEYFVAAVYRQDNYARTFFPGTPYPGSAEQIALKEGGDAASINFDFRAVNRLNISGRIVSTIPASTEQPVSPRYYLIPRDRGHYMDINPVSLQNVAADKSNGQFELQNVAPDSYDLIATMLDGNDKIVTGRTSIYAGREDLQGLTINLHPGVSVRARIVYAGGSAPVDASSFRLQIRPLETFATAFTNGITTIIGDEAAGATTFSNVSEARYTFNVTGLPPYAYVADIRTGGRSIFDEGLLVGERPPELIDVVVNLTDTVIEGTVFNAKQKPVAVAKVVLVPQMPRRNNTALYRAVSADGSGHFTLHGVPPGEYRVFAWENAPPAFAWEDPGFMSKYEQYGKTVVVAPSGIRDFQVQAIP